MTFLFSMTDTKPNGNRRGPSSFIPIAMPLMQARTSLSFYPQNLNTNKSGLIPDSNSVPHLPSQSRSFSVGHSPSPQTSPNSKPSFTLSNSNVGQPQLQQQSTPVSAGKTTFRSFRNLLPFGPGKPSASPNTSSSFVLNPKRSFSLGQRPAKEKEKGDDKKPKSPIPNPPDLPDPQKPPVLVIEYALPPSEIGLTASPRVFGLSSLPPQLPLLQLRSGTQQSAPPISTTLPLPTSVPAPSSVSASPSRIDHGMSLHCVHHLGLHLVQSSIAPTNSLICSGFLQVLHRCQLPQYPKPPMQPTIRPEAIFPPSSNRRLPQCRYRSTYRPWLRKSRRMANWANRGTLTTQTAFFRMG